MSDVQRQHALEFFGQTLSTRLDDKKRDAIVVVMQRLHEGDLAAKCKELGYTEICLPAVAERRTTITFPRSGRQVTREVGDLLWEAREGRSQLDELKVLLGSSGFASQYQQSPMPPGGRFFKADWFQFYDELPELEECAHSWDMSFKGGSDADYVVGLAAGRKYNSKQIYILHRSKGQWSFTETLRQVELLLERCPADSVFVEDAANGPAVVDTLKDTVSGLIAVRPNGGKESRANAAQPRVEAGQIFLPNPRPHGVLRPDRTWVEDFLHQLEVFPRGTNDDDVDAFTQLVTNWEAAEDTSLVWR